MHQQTQVRTITAGRRCYFRLHSSRLGGKRARCGRTACPEASQSFRESALPQSWPFSADLEQLGVELHSFMLSRNGSVIAEGWWWPYQPQRMHMTTLLTKSVMVSGVGIAIDEGRFSLDDKVVSFFPEHLPPDPDPNLLAMTVRDLLTMRTGQDHETSGSECGVHSSPVGLQSL